MKKISEYCRLAAAELTVVAERVDDGAFEQVASELVKAKRIFTLGGGREGLMVRAFTMRLMHLGKQAHWVWDDTTPSIGPGDVLFVATGSCTGGVLIHVAKMAKEHGAKVIVVTADNAGPVGRYADVTAFVPAAPYLAKGDLVPSEQMMGSLFEQSLLILFDSMTIVMRDMLHETVQSTEARHRNVE